MIHRNLINCGKCKGTFIAEEFETHICQTLIIETFDLTGNRWGSYDRINFFRLPSFPKIPDGLLQRHNYDLSDGDDTEPYIGLGFCKSIAYIRRYFTNF